MRNGPIMPALDLLKCRSDARRARMWQGKPKTTGSSRSRRRLSLTRFGTPDQDEHNRVRTSDNKLAFALVNAAPVHSFKEYERLL